MKSAPTGPVDGSGGLVLHGKTEYAETTNARIEKLRYLFAFSE